MVKNNKTNFSTELSEIIIEGIQEKKGQEIVRLDLRDVDEAVADYFIVCHANSPSQMEAIAKSVEEEVYKGMQQTVWRKEGIAQGEWILIDFVDVVVHVFRTEIRAHYQIEDLWGDADIQVYRSA